MQVPFISKPRPPETLRVGDREIPLLLVRNPRARRYFLRLSPDGTARVTIPRGGTVGFGKEFAKANQGWLEKQLAKPPPACRQWKLGDTLLFRGESVQIRLEETENTKPRLLVGPEKILINDSSADLRPAIQRHFWKLAARELEPRVWELAALHELTVRRVTVRNQKSRWGSCSRRGTVSLNWRLIQTPPSVSDYIILHELMHLRQMNHSARFWMEVSRVCPNYEAAEAWVKRNGSLLR
ncbi:MAG: metal-dependent hydrolase [Verrucomicrobiales bacterium]|nr:metal-dependent hydrolase [Verrucomicrobiales bacterium]